MAAATQIFQDKALRLDATRRRGIVQREEQFHGAVAGACLHGNRSLAGGRKHPVEHLKRETQPIDPQFPRGKVMTEAAESRRGNRVAS